MILLTEVPFCLPIMRRCARAMVTMVKAGVVQPTPAPRFAAEAAPVSADRPARSLDQALADWSEPASRLVT